MGFTYQHECPQCGGPFELDETDRLIKCQFCNTFSYLHSDDYFRFVLPSKNNEPEKVYVPYLRFKGAMYSCFPEQIKYRLIDISQAGLEFDMIPPSLGMRPQAMQMKFASTIKDGRLLKGNLSIDEAIARTCRTPGLPSRKVPSYQTFIGDTASIIYMPLTIHDGTIFDGVTNNMLGKLPQDLDLFAPITDNNLPPPANFLATICPQCGWNLVGEADALVLLCPNCNSAWEPRGKSFARLNFKLPKTKIESVLFLPFWKISATADEIDLSTFNDFIAITKQPMVSRKGLENKVMAYWAPAFKIRPKTFLRLCNQLTIAQPDIDGTESIADRKCHPVTLPASEALQSLKLTLANCAVVKKHIYPAMADIEFSVRDISLNFIPFTLAGYGLYQEQLKININKQHLKFGRRL